MLCASIPSPTRRELPPGSSFSRDSRRGDEYALSNAPETTSLETFVAMSKHRWSIERCFLEGKSSLGMGHHEHRACIATCSMSSSPIFYHDRPAETRRKKRSLLFHGRRALCPGARPGRGDYPRPLSHPTQQDRGVFPQKENLYHSERISVLLEPPVDLIFSSPNCPFSIPRLPRSEVGRHPRCVLFAPSLSCFRQNSLQESLKTRVTSRSGPFFPHTPSFCLRYEPIDSRSGRIPSNDGR